MTTEAETREAPSWRRRALDYIDRAANPVLLRDLRLYMRGRMMIASYFLTLAILVLAAIAYAMAARWGGMDGSRLLFVPTYLLAVICGALVPNLVGERFRSELSSRATELALVSPLTPARLVRGKLIGAWCMSLLVVSASMPVLATAYLLGGVGPMDILGLAGGVLLAGAVMPLPQMYLATGARQKGSGRILFGLLFAGNIVLMLSYAALLQQAFSAQVYGRRHLFYVLYALIVAALLIAQFLYFVTVNRLRGEAENRDAAPRLSLAAAVVLGVALAYGMRFLPDADIGEGPLEMLCIAAFPASLAFAWGMFVVSHGNGSQQRLLRESGRMGPFGRAFLQPGPASLTAFFLVAAAFLAGLGSCGLLDPDRLGSTAHRFADMTLSPLLFVAYGLAAYFYCVRPFLRAAPPPTLLPNVILITNIALAVVAVFAMVILGPFEDEIAIYPYLLGITPTGLFTAASSSSMAGEAVSTGLFTLSLLGLLLLPAALRRRPDPWHGPAERRDAA